MALELRQVFVRAVVDRKDLAVVHGDADQHG
jgi:hypothetical protein